MRVGASSSAARLAFDLTAAGGDSKEERVASLIGRAVKLARSPARKRLVAEAQKAARDPKNRQRIEQVRQRFSKR